MISKMVLKSDIKLDFESLNGDKIEKSKCDSKLQIVLKYNLNWSVRNIWKVED